MGEVFLVEVEGDGSFRKKAALKKQLPNLRTDKEFEKEANLLSKLTHPNVVSVYNYWIDEGRPHILMEYVSGRSLQEVLEGLEKIGHGLPSDQVVEILNALLHALEYLQSGGEKLGAETVLHLDLTPHNVKIDQNGSLKLLDFGVAKTLDPNQTSSLTMNISGKPGYFAPELINENKLSPAADIFSVGVMAYELLTGQKLFSKDGGTAALRKIAALTDRDVEELAKKLPDLNEAVKSLLTPDPKERMRKLAGVKDYLQSRCVHTPSKNLYQRLEEVLETAPVEVQSSEGNKEEIGALEVLLRPLRRFSPRLRTSLTRVSPIAGTAGAAADFASPLGNYSDFLSWTSGLLTLLLSLLWYAIRKPFIREKLPFSRLDPRGATLSIKSDRIPKAITYTFCATVIFISFSVIRAKASAKETGVLASQIPGIASLQKALFRLEKMAVAMNEKIDRIESHVSQMKKAYTKDQLVKLGEQELWTELLTHIGDVDPLQRDQEWAELLEKSTYEALNELLRREDFNRAIEISSPLFENFKPLKKSKRVMKLHREIGLKHIENCLRARESPENCHTLSLRYIDYDSEGRGPLAYEIGKLTTFHRFHRYALPYFQIAVEEAGSREICGDDRLRSALTNIAGWDKEDPLTKSASKIKKHCKI